RAATTAAAWSPPAHRRRSCVRPTSRTRASSCVPRSAARGRRRAMRRTKIVCTIGPASCTVEQLDRLTAAGMDVARLNFSHGTHAEHADVVRRIRDGETRWGRTIAILQDLQGPKIRLGTFGPGGGGRVDLEGGKRFTLVARTV